MAWRHLGSVGAFVLALVLVACGGDSEQEAIADAKAAIEKKDEAAARIRLKNALEKHPTSAEARYLFGKLLLEAGEIQTAEIELRKAQELNHPADEVAPLLARVMLASQRPTKVIEEFAGLKLASPDRHADLSAEVAMAYAMSGQLDKAAALVGEVIGRTPGHAPTRLLQARLVAGRGDADSALKVLDGVLARDASNIDALRMRGDLLLFGKRDGPAAAVAYRKVLEAKKDDVYTQSRLIGLALVERDIKGATSQYESLAKLQPQHPQVQLLGAQIALLNGNPGRAKELTAQLMKVTRDHPAVLLLAATAEFELKSLAQAETHLSKLLAANPKSGLARRLMAMVQLRRGEPAKALEVLGPALDSEAPDSNALTLAAEAHLATGDTRSAEAFFARIAKLKPDDVKARTALALVQIGKGDREAALAELQSIASADQGTLADMALINVRLRQRDFDSALSAIAALERKQPSNPLPADLRGRVLLLKRDITNARASFEAALKRDPIYFPSASALAAMDIAERRPEQAAQRFEAVLKADAKNVQALVALAGLKTRQKANPAEVAQLLGQAIESRPGEPTAHVLLVEHWLRQSNPKQAVTAAQAGLAANPEAPALLDALGRAQLANDEIVQSLATFGKLAVKQPKSALAQMRVADGHLRAKNPEAAERALRNALEISPELLVAQRELIALAVQAKQPEKALAVARAIQKQRPKHAIGHLVEGEVHIAFKDTDAAIKAMRAGLPKQGGGLVAARLHHTLAAAGRKADADRFGDEWTKQNPKETALRTHLARTALAAGDFALAERLYREVITLNPGHLLATNDLAWLLAKTGRPGAVEMAERALLLAPESPNTLDTLAFVLAEAGQLPRAIETAKSAVRLAPEAPLFHLTLAKLYLKANDKKSAKAELDELAKLGARFPQHKEVAELMRTL